MTKSAQRICVVRLKRDIHDTLLRFAKFPVVGLFGPRQILIKEQQHRSIFGVIKMI